MVSLQTIDSSNERIKTTLPAGLVAVFVGGTNGVGETTVKQFAKYALQPRVYILGRSREAGTRIVAECEELNPEGTFTFLQRDMSLMHEVDAVCNELLGKEDAINLLFLTIGTLQRGFKTAEGLHYPAALTIYARNHFISRLLPSIRNAKHLRRVVTVFGATFEGQIVMEDFQGMDLGRIKLAGHEGGVTTMALEAHQKIAPEVSFVHNFPGAVESGISRGSIGWLMRTLKTIWGFLGPLVHIPLEEAGNRHLFFCTSARFSVGPDDPTAGVPLADNLALVKGTNGEPGSGVYSIGIDGESGGSRKERLFADLRSEGLEDKVKERIRSDIDAVLVQSKT